MGAKEEKKMYIHKNNFKKFFFQTWVFIQLLFDVENESKIVVVKEKKQK
jgi:hypothetical protein